MPNGIMVMLKSKFNKFIYYLCCNFISSFFRCKSNRGIFPKSYVKLVEFEILKNDYVIKRTDIVNEITTVLGDWGELFKEFFLSNHDDFQPIRQKILKLIKLRSQVLSENLPIDEIKEVKLAATSEIDTGNSMLRKFSI